MRGLFIDRWGTLLELPKEPPARTLKEVKFTRGSLEAMQRAGHEGWELYLIGNEDAVAFGALPLAQWKCFEAELLEFLAKHGVPIKRSYACLDHPQGVKGHTRDSVFLLPNTGLLYHAAQFDGISLRHSWVVGDGVLELVAGWRAGCHVAGVGLESSFVAGELSVEPELCHSRLAQVLSELRQREPIPERLPRSA